MKNDTGVLLRRFLAVSILSCLAFSVSGCFQDTAQMEKKILSHDPSFQSVIKKKNFLNAELDSLKAAFVKVRNTIDTQISLLRDKRVRARKEYDASAEKIRLQFQPEVRRVERDLMDARHRYDQKSLELREIERDMNEVNYLIKKKDKLILTEEEMKTWSNRLADLSEKKSDVLGEMAKIKEELNISKMKLKVMNLK